MTELPHYSNINIHTAKRIFSDDTLDNLVYRELGNANMYEYTPDVIELTHIMYKKGVLNLLVRMTCENLTYDLNDNIRFSYIQNSIDDLVVYVSISITEEKYNELCKDISI